MVLFFLKYYSCSQLGIFCVSPPGLLFQSHGLIFLRAHMDIKQFFEFYFPIQIHDLFMKSGNYMTKMCKNCEIFVKNVEYMTKSKKFVENPVKLAKISSFSSPIKKY